MGKPYADHTQAQTQQPLIINPKTVDEYNDAALLDVSTVLAQGDNIILDDGVIEKVPGTVKISANSGTVLSAAAVMGLHRTYSVAGTKIALKLYNGTLYSASAPNATTKFATTVLTNLATNKRTPWVDIRGKAYGINETDGIIRYDAKIAAGHKIGVVGPYLRKQIAFFEDNETWLTTNGGSQSTAMARPEEWTGKTIKSLRLYCSAASTNASASCSIPLNLSVFSDSKAVTDDDYISFYTFHGNRTNLSGVLIDFSTGGTTFAKYYRAYVDQSLFEDGDHAWTKFNIRRGAFSAVSTADWSKVSAVRLTAKSNTVGATTVHFDYMYLKACPPKPAEMRRNVFKCESNSQETWTAFSNCGYNFKKQHEGIRSLRFGTNATASAACNLVAPINLATWQNGVSTQDSDELVFYLRQTATDALSAATPLTVYVGKTSAHCVKRTFGKLSAIGMTGANQWAEVRIPKGRISAAVSGTMDWSSVGYTAFKTSKVKNGEYLYLDDCFLEQKIDTKQIADFESDEAWVFTGNGESNVEDPQGKGWVTEGTGCLRLWALRGGNFSESYAAITLGSTLDLTAWTDGGNSGTDDEICFSLYHQTISKINYVEIWFANNADATYTDAYKYRITKDMFAGGGTKNHMGKEIRIRKADFEKIGSAGAWSTIHSIKIVASSKGSKNAGSVYIDNLQLRRKSGFTGRYYYKYIHKVDDICSAASEVSEYVDVQGAQVAISNISTSQDSRVTTREVYRLGGTYPDTWGLIKVIEDNTTTEVIDDIDDDEIVYFLGDDVPLGWINSVLCNNVVYDPYSDRAYYWGDPTYKNRVWFSHPGFYHVVDEWGYREFPDDVQAVVPWFGQNIIFYRHSIQKVVNGDMTTGQLINVPANMGACSYWAVGKPWNGMIPYVGQDNVYLFDGIRPKSIGNEIKGYLKGNEQSLSILNVGVVKDSLYVACLKQEMCATTNNRVLRCYLPTRSWTVLPNWNVNVFSNWDKQSDANEMYYGDSNYGHVYKINDTEYQFGSTNILSTVGTGWLSVPDADIAVQMIEFKAKGDTGSTLTFNGYTNLDGSVVTTGAITLNSDWQVFRLGPKGIMELLQGNNVKLEFTQSAQNAYFKIKDIIIYYEKMPERVSITTANEVSCAAP